MESTMSPHQRPDASASAPAEPDAEAGALSLNPTENVNVEAAISLIAPRDLHAQLPQTAESQRTVLDGRRSIEAILSGEDPRVMIVVGPCSIHDEKAAIEYAERLTKLREKTIDRLFLVMRVYFEKPRTTVGWKGLINDPHLNGSFDIVEGLERARKLLLAITGMGLPTATEMLDPITPQYIADLVCWTAIGARTTESQTHRQMASGLSMPVGYKNSTEGNMQIAADAMRAARSAHAFLGMDELGRTAVIKTRGNRFGHMILRGGREASNFAPRDVAAAAALLEKENLPTCLMVDCSHANAGKRPEKQQVVLRSVIDQRVKGNRNLIGLMLESNLFEGNQKMADKLEDLKYGVSITDPCIGWEETEALIMWAHEQLG